MTALNFMVSRAAAWYGTRTAVEDGTRALSFTDVEQRSNRLAHALLARSGERGARVAMLLPNRLESVEVDFAIMKAGKAKIPVNVRLRNAERAFLLADSGAETLIFDSSGEESVAEIAPELPDLRHLIRLGPGRLGASYEDLLAAGATTLPEIVLGADDPSLFLYTSGTTGRPKGAVTTNFGRLMGTLNMLASEIDPRPAGAMVHVGSMAHGSGSKTLAHFLRGSRNIPVAQWDPERFLDLVARTRATHSFLVPTMIDQLTAATQSSPADWSCLRAITYGGAPMPASRLAAALAVFDGRLVQVYGSCEAPHPVLVLDADAHARGGDILSAAGREVVGVEVRLVRSDGSDSPAGEPGEMLVRGPNVMSGYWNRPEATAEVLVGGWYHTGDVARRDAEGYLHIIDRVRDVIISGGYNVYPAELEAVLAAHPAVAGVAVVGVPDERWGESVRAVVVRREGSAVTAEDLIGFCADRVAGYKKPRGVDFVTDLPLGSTGKVLRREIRDRYWTGQARRV
jgi:acyl-CoA synthetase (AMP-forming)/AMP-acid ligase II